MKPKHIIAIIIFTVFNLSLFAEESVTELWNGFTDQMTRAQVITKAEEMFNAETRNDTCFANTRANRKDFMYNYNGNEYLRFFPEPITSISYFTKYPGFHSDPFFDRFNLRGNIRFYFYNNTLYCIEIEYNEDIMDSVIEKAKKHYGNIYTNKPYSNSLFWDLRKREIYLVKYPNDNIFLVLSKKILKNYEADLKIKQEKENKEFEEKMKTIENQIKF